MLSGWHGQDRPCGIINVAFEFLTFARVITHLIDEGLALYQG